MQSQNNPTRNIQNRDFCGGMIRGYDSGYDSGVWFAQVEHPTLTKKGARQKKTQPYDYICNLYIYIYSMIQYDTVCMYSSYIHICVKGSWCQRGEPEDQTAQPHGNCREHKPRDCWQRVWARPGGFFMRTMAWECEAILKISKIWSLCDGLDFLGPYGAQKKKKFSGASPNGHPAMGFPATCNPLRPLLSTSAGQTRGPPLTIGIWISRGHGPL